MDKEESTAFSFWRDRTTSPFRDGKGDWEPVNSGVTKTSKPTRPLTARLQAPKLGAQGENVVAGFAEQQDFFAKVSKDCKTSNLFVYRDDVAQHERDRAKDRGLERHSPGQVDVHPMKPVTFFAKHGRDMGFTLTSPSRDSILSRKATVQLESSGCAAEAGSQKQELRDEISHFERTHLAHHGDFDDTPPGSPADSPEPDANPWPQSLVPTEDEKVHRGLADLEKARGNMGGNFKKDMPKSLSPSVLGLMQRHPSLLDIEVDTLNKPAAAPDGAGALSPRSPVSPSQRLAGKGAKLPSLSSLPFSPPPVSVYAGRSPRSPCSPRRDLPGTWDSRHPHAVDHECSMYKSGALTDRSFRADVRQKQDPLNTHRAHGFSVGAHPDSAPHPPTVSDVSAVGRNAQWVRQVGQGTWQGGRVASIAPFYRSWDVYSSAKFKTEIGRIKAAQDRRQLLEEPATGTGLDPSPHVPIGPLRGRRRAWNFRYDMTYEETVSRDFDLDTSPYAGADSRVWKASVMRSKVAQNGSAAWPGTVSGDLSLEGARRNRTLPQGHSGDFRSINVRQTDGTYKQRPVSPSQGKLGTSLVVQTSKDYITDVRHFVKGGRYYTDEPSLPASPSSPGPWRPPHREPGAGWAQGVMAAASSLPSDRANLPEKAVPPYKPLASILADHDHRGLDENSVGVQWQPYSRDRGPRHDATKWKHYFSPPGMKLFVRPSPLFFATGHSRVFSCR